jgi:hypothetical protein
MTRGDFPGPGGKHARMERRALLTWALIACVVGLTGCGSGGASRTGTGKQAGSAAASGEAAKPPEQIVADATAAMRSARGYIMRGSITQNHQLLQLEVAAPDSRSLQVAFSINGASVSMVVLPSGSYLRGNTRFWMSHLGARAGTLANRWIQVPASHIQALTSSLGHFQPATLARCLAEDHGTLSLAGRTTVSGRPAVVIRDAGNVPGSSKGTLAVAATGTPFPLRAINDGGQRAGGRVDVCNDGRASQSRGSLTFSHFGAVPPLAAPRDPLRLGPNATV